MSTDLGAATIRRDSYRADVAKERDYFGELSPVGQRVEDAAILQRIQRELREVNERRTSVVLSAAISAIGAVIEEMS